MKTGVKWMIVVSVVFLMFFGNRSWADQPTGATSAQELEQKMKELQRKVGILTDELQDLKVDLYAPDEPVDLHTSHQGLGPAASKIYGVNRGISFGGYGEMVYQIDLDDSSSAQIDFLRMVLYTGYRFSDKILFNTEVEFEHATTGHGVGEVSVEFAYLDFLLHPTANIRTGMMLIPMGFINEIHEPPFYHGVQRPRTERVIIPATWRENGVGLYGKLPREFNYRLYVTNSVAAVNGKLGTFSASSGIRGGRQKGAKAKAKDVAISGRLDYKGFPGLVVGGSFFFGNAGQGAELSDGTEIEAQVTLVDVHAQYQYRGLELRGLYVSGEIDDKEEINEFLGLDGNKSIGDMVGWYVQGAYDVGPKMMATRNFYLAPFFRWEEFNTQTSVPVGFRENPDNDIRDIVVGLTFKPSPIVSVKMDWTSRETNGGHGGKQSTLFNLGLGYAF